jgi:hypothetical protein
MQSSNYPPGVTGAEPEIVGDPSGDEANFGSVRYGIESALANLGEPQATTGAAAKKAAVEHLREALADLDVLEIEDLEEPDVEEEEVTTSTELEVGGEFDDLRILEIPLEPEHAKNLLGFDYDVQRYAILGVPKAGFTEGDRLDVQRILYAVRIQKPKESPDA